MINKNHISCLTSLTVCSGSELEQKWQTVPFYQVKLVTSSQMMKRCIFVLMLTLYSVQLQYQVQPTMCLQPNMHFIHNQRAYVFLWLTLGLYGARNEMECKTPDGAIKRAIRPNLCYRTKSVKLVHEFSAWPMNSRCVYWAGVSGWYLLRILPPLFPFIGIVCSNWQITNGGIKPHVEHLQRRRNINKLWIIWI